MRKPAATPAELEALIKELETNLLWLALGGRGDELFTSQGDQAHADAIIAAREAIERRSNYGNTLRESEEAVSRRRIEEQEGPPERPQVNFGRSLFARFGRARGPL